MLFLCAVRRQLLLAVLAIVVISVDGMNSQSRLQSSLDLWRHKRLHAHRQHEKQPPSGVNVMGSIATPTGSARAKLPGGQFIFRAPMATDCDGWSACPRHDPDGQVSHASPKCFRSQ